MNRERYGSTISSGSSTLSSVVRQGSRLGAWKAMPLIFSGPARRVAQMMSATATTGLSQTSAWGGPGGDIEEDAGSPMATPSTRRAS